MIVNKAQTNARRGHRFLLVSSLLALLAFAFSPVALADSSGQQYEDALPTPTGGKKPEHKSQPKATKSSQPGGTAAPSSGGGSGSSGSDGGSSTSPSGGSGNTTATGNGGGTAQSSQPSGQGNSGNSTAKNQSAPQPTTQASPVSSKTSSDDGGSSPLVPILIAIAVLAAISVGVVVMRQRRQRDGGQVSPKPSS